LLLAGYIDGEGPDGLGSIRASTPDQGRAIVRRYKTSGFEQIKIYGNGALKRDIVSAIVDEAHKLGMTVTGHIPRGMNAIEAVEIGFDQINHIGFLFSVLRPTQPAGQRRMDLGSAEARRAIQFFKERGTVIEPTFARFELNTHPVDTPFVQFEPGMARAPKQLADIFDKTGLDAERAERARASAEQSAAVLRALRDAGIPIVAGIDLVLPGHSLHRELELYVKAGLTPMEAIQTATIVPARAMKLDSELGTLERGKQADLVILDGDPLASISNIRRIKYVVKAGGLYDPAPLWRVAGFHP
jgi:imidazolonepropionase-like amidohydrolase